MVTIANGTAATFLFLNLITPSLLTAILCLSPTHIEPSPTKTSLNLFETEPKLIVLSVSGTIDFFNTISLAVFEVIEPTLKSIVCNTPETSNNSAGVKVFTPILPSFLIIILSSFAVTNNNLSSSCPGADSAFIKVSLSISITSPNFCQLVPSQPSNTNVSAL